MQSADAPHQRRRFEGVKRGLLRWGSVQAPQVDDPPQGRLVGPESVREESFEVLKARGAELVRARLPFTVCFARRHDNAPLTALHEELAQPSPEATLIGQDEPASFSFKAGYLFLRRRIQLSPLHLVQPVIEVLRGAPFRAGL